MYNIYIFIIGIKTHIIELKNYNVWGRGGEDGEFF